jgi:TRAP-type C4-dicarboxylate transport system substrate-binding protein
MRKAVKDAVAFQRGLAGEEDKEARAAIEREGCEIADLTPAELAAFAAAVKPLRDEARGIYGQKMFDLLPAA